MSAVALLTNAGVARAASIFVNTNLMTTNSGDGKCTLTEAVKAVNTQLASGSLAGECPAGNGMADKITLMGSPQTYSTNSELTIYRNVEIAGAGEGVSTLSTGALYGITVDDRLHVGAYAFIHHLTIQNSRSDGLPVFCARADGSDPLGSPRLSMHYVTITKCSTGVVASGSGNETFSGRFLTVKNNNGPGIQVSESSVDLKYSLISGNTNSGILSTGTRSSSMVLDYTTIDGNSAINGGGIHLEGGIPGIININNSTISNNTAVEDGGGIYDLGHLTVRTSTISGNRAARGGGLYHNSFGECYFYSSTVAFNAASSKGGGVYSEFGSNAAMLGSIVAKNTAPIGPDCNGPLNGGTVPVSGSKSLLGNSTGCPTSGTGFIIQNQDPKLGALSSTGVWGATQVHPLLKGSPAINQAGSGSGVDQRGMWRPDPVVQADGFVAPGTDQDIGAYEYSTIWPYQVIPVPATSGDARDSTGRLLTYSADAVDDYITFSPLIAEAGTYTVRAQVQKWNQGGIYQLQTAETLGGTYTNLVSQDLYAPTTSTPALTFGTVTFASAGLKYLRFRVTGRAAASSGYKLYLAYIKLVKA